MTIKNCINFFFDTEIRVWDHLDQKQLLNQLSTPMFQVVGYSIMGAFIFVYLEKENEIHTRQKGEDFLNKTLDQLYDITGRHEVHLIGQQGPTLPRQETYKHGKVVNTMYSLYTIIKRCR